MKSLSDGAGVGKGRIAGRSSNHHPMIVGALEGMQRRFPPDRVLRSGTVSYPWDPRTFRIQLMGDLSMRIFLPGTETVIAWSQPGAYGEVK